MLKHLMNGGSLLSYALYDAESEAKAARDATRAELLKNNTVVVTDPPADKEGEEEDKDKDKEGDEEDDDDEEDDKKEENKDKDKDPNEGLTPEQIKEKEAADKAAAKLQRKNDRMQRRIDEATARAKAAEDELKKFKEANPDSKLTEEEVEAKATLIAEKKLKDKELADLQADFEKTCDKIQKAALKADPKFDDNIADIAEQFGPIPSFMIGVIDDFENGGKVLAHIAADDDLAEKLWGLKNKPAKLTRELVELSSKLLAAEKKPKKQISKVETITPVQGNNVQSTIITSEDTKPENMDRFVAKRKAMQEERRKAGVR